MRGGGGQSVRSSSVQGNIKSNDFICGSLSDLKIKAICSDVDGTLLDSKHQLPGATLRAITRVVKDVKDPPFFLCTGRSRRSMSLATGKGLTSVWSDDGGYESIPGVFQQGLMVFSESSLIYERALAEEAPTVIDIVIEFCKAEGVTVIAYAGEQIIAEKITEECRSLTVYHEPMPQVFPPGIAKLSEHGIKTHKLILLDKQEILEGIRPKLAAALGSQATLTSAVPGMLEVLPPGTNKGLGVQQLLRHYGVHEDDHVVAFGDGENDIEFLSDAVSHGIAVANANPKLKSVARWVSTSSNDDNCVADILNSLFL